LHASKQRKTAIVQSSGPVVLSGAPAVSPRLDTAWYLVHPGSAPMTLFNPDSHAAAVNVRYVGAKTVTGQQLRLGARRTYPVSTHGARAVVITSSRPVSIGHVAADAVTSGGLSPATSSTVTTAGPARSVTLFNPDAQRAHVSYTLVGRTT